MSKHMLRWGLGALAVLGFLGDRASAQFAANPYVMTPQQYFMNLQNAGTNPLGGGVNPYTPFAGGNSPYGAANSPFSAGATNPYAAGNPYSPYYGLGATGGALYGQSEVVRAYGTLINNVEQARIYREMAIQAKFDTQRKRFDLDMYIRANTPTFTDEQAKVAKTTLKRIQVNSTPAEITNGQALNYLLDDVKRFPNKKAAMDDIPVSEELLRQLNVTATIGSIGILRNEGKFTWPLGIYDILTPDQMKNMELQTQALVSGAAKGKIDANVYKDLSTELDKAMDTLKKKVNDVPTPQFLEAQRFLNDFREARIALERGEYQNQTKFQKFITGGKSVQQVVEYMISSGLKFAPATALDEAAYRALHSALVSYDVALNAQLGSPSETKDP